MKENVLKPHGKKRERFALKAFLWGAVIAAVFVIPSMILEKGMFLYYGDYNFQVIPFYQLMVEAIHKGEWGWNWYTDLGSSFVGSYSFYNLGSPFFWVLLLFPSKAVPYVMGPLTIVKFGISSLSAYLFLKRYTKNRYNALIGALLYAFSGAAMYNLVFHFIDAMAIFPLLLVALDMYIYEDKRGWFAAAVALSALTNYYLFAGEVVFCLIYWLVRMITKSYKIDARRVFYLGFEAVLGTGIAALILLPTVYHLVGNNRVSASGLGGWGFWVYNTGYVYINTIISFFMPPEYADANTYITDYNTTWCSITAYLPVFGMSGVFAVILNKHRNKWIRVFYAVCAVFMFIPGLNSTFQFFTDAKYLRWFFMLLLIMALGSVTALEDPSTKWKKSIVLNGVITAVIVLVIGLTPVKTVSDDIETTKIGLSGSSGDFWIFAAVAFINIAICLLFLRLYKEKREVYNRFGALIVSAAILTTLASTYVSSKYQGAVPLSLINNGYITYEEDMGIDDIQQWRSDTVTKFSYSHLAYDKDSVGTLDYAAIDSDNDEFVDAKMSDLHAPGVYNEDDNLTMFWKIPGFGSFHSLVNGSITKFYEGIGFTRETLSNLPTGMYGLRSIFADKYMFNHSDNVLTLKDEKGDVILPGWKLLKTWNGFDIYENEYAVPIATTFDKFMLSSDFEKIPPQFSHLVLCDTLVTESIDDMFNMTAANMKQVFPEDFDYTQEEYFKACEARIAAGCTDFSRDKKGFEFKITAGEDEEYVFISVPYDKGWSATVNGSKAEVRVIDYGFMTVKIPAGQESTVRFDYHTQGTFYGAFISVVCLLMLIIYLAVVKVRRRGEQAEEAAKLIEGSGEKQVDKKPDEKPDEKTDAKPEEKTDGKPATENEEEDLDEMTIFDIVKQTEEQTMMHVYKRVPVVLERGFGSVAYDINNKKYIDFTSGIGVNALGYADGRWGEAVEKQIYSVQHTSNLYYNTTQISLAEMLCMKTGFSKVFFANSGAEANECAIKIARKYGSDRFGEKHTHIITLENSFHGRTITTLSATGQDVFHKYFTPFTEGFSFAKANDMESIKACTTDDTCAVMIELIQGEGGVNPLDKKFVQDLAAYCKERDLLLIVDEIQTGVGRTGKLYCYENFGIEPDVITSAKALSGGLPLSACMCNEKLKDVLSAGTNGTTFGGNPIACAGALKILEIVSDEEFLAGVREKGEYMRTRIKEMKGVKEVRGLGMMIGIVLEKDNAGEVLGKCAENGLLVLTAKSLVRLLPPLNIEYEDIDEGLDILEQTILETLDDEENDKK